jgi:hypothetical protein
VSNDRKRASLLHDFGYMSRNMATSQLAGSNFRSSPPVVTHAMKRAACSLNEPRGCWVCRSAADPLTRPLSKRTTVSRAQWHHAAPGNQLSDGASHPT